MKRRKFVKISSASLLPLLLGGCIRSATNQEQELDFDISIHNDSLVGHQLMNALDYKVSKSLFTETLIVGGGISGLSAACKLQSNNSDYILCELSDQFGGTSGSNEYMGQRFSQGAHYDLAYPNYFGKEVLELFESLNIITFNNLNSLWEFKDKKYLIPSNIESRCVDGNEVHDSVLKENELSKQFFNGLSEFEGKMPLPTRLINKKYHHLNHISFYDYLTSRHKITSDFISSINYQMRDDYGGNSNEISALAGIHYYKCRPYYENDIELFSPPEGNNYFVKKILANLDKGRLLINSLVSHIEKHKNNYIATVVDIPNKMLIKIKAKKIIYAAQKNTLKYVSSQHHKAFINNKYAPWMVINIVLNNNLKADGIWQNEVLNAKDHFIGFVDSKAQYTDNSDVRILSAYYCLPQESRAVLLNISGNKKNIVAACLKEINKYFGYAIDNMIQKVHIKVLGHAMPIPYPGYLFNDRNTTPIHKGFVFAGVDNGRLPLLFEAVDSGILASELI